LRSGETSQLSASSGVTLPSELILVRVSKMLYSDDFGYRRGGAGGRVEAGQSGSSAMPRTIVSLRDWASEASGRVAREAAATELIAKITAFHGWLSC
jgi:hypothetical protein